MTTAEVEPTTTETSALSPPPGWRQLGGLAGDADVFTLDTSHANYPEEYRSLATAADIEHIAASPEAQDATQRLRAEVSLYNMVMVREALNNGAERKRVDGNDQLLTATTALILRTRQLVHNEADKLGKIGSRESRIRYLAETSLPAELIPFVDDEVPEPLKMIVNADPERVLLLGLMPGQSVIIFEANTNRTTITEQMGRFITAALDLQREANHHTRPRPPRRIEDPKRLRESLIVAFLKDHDERTSQQIVRALEWIEPETDWRDVRETYRSRCADFYKDGQKVYSSLYPDLHPSQWPDPDQALEDFESRGNTGFF